MLKVKVGWNSHLLSRHASTIEYKLPSRCHAGKRLFEVKMVNIWKPSKHYLKMYRLDGINTLYVVPPQWKQEPFCFYGCQYSFMLWNFNSSLIVIEYKNHSLKCKVQETIWKPYWWWNSVMVKTWNLVCSFTTCILVQTVVRNHKAIWLYGLVWFVFH